MSGMCVTASEPSGLGRALSPCMGIRSRFSEGRTDVCSWKRSGELPASRRRPWRPWHEATDSAPVWRGSQGDAVTEDGPWGRSVAARTEDGRPGPHSEGRN